MNFHKLKEKEQILFRPESGYDNSYETLPAAIYKLSDMGNIFSGEIPSFKPILPKDSLVKFNGGALGEFIREVDTFFSPVSTEGYKEMSLNHKIGFILYGKHGTGKTSMCTLAMTILCQKYEALCLDCTEMGLGFVIRSIASIRNYQKNPIVIFYDECENSLTYEENAFLPFLDGNGSVEDLIFLGCTNYINKIPKRIKNRKSRIKKCIEITSLPLEIYKQYISTKLPNLGQKEMFEFAFKAEQAELTIDQFKNALIDYRINHLPIDEAIAESKEEYKAADEETND